MLFTIIDVGDSFVSSSFVSVVVEISCVCELVDWIVLVDVVSFCSIVLDAFFSSVKIGSMNLPIDDSHPKMLLALFLVVVPKFPVPKTSSNGANISLE